MAESVTFSLDNKHSVGTKAAQLGDQLLVNYRDRFYLIMNGTALMKGGKPLRYSLSSLPAVWKKALRGRSLSSRFVIYSCAGQAGKARRCRESPREERKRDVCHAGTSTGSTRHGRINCSTEAAGTESGESRQ